MTSTEAYNEQTAYPGRDAGINKPLELIKNRSDIGAGTRGSDLGVDALEIAAINNGSHFFQLHPHVDVPTRNASIYENDVNPYGKHIKQIYEQCVDVAAAMQKSLNAGRFPLVFSGDHSSAIGTISGIKASFPEATLGVLWIDAHADIHAPYTTPSGNLHGMPLAALLGEDNLPCQINDVDASTTTSWNRLKNIGLPRAKFLPEHLIYFGVRDTEQPEDDVIERLGIRNYRVEEVRTRGAATCTEEALDALSSCDLLYVSFDVDSLDSERVSGGTGTPVPSGFFPEEVAEILQRALRSPKAVCLEIVEINPLLDKENSMAEVVFHILAHALPHKILY